MYVYVASGMRRGFCLIVCNLIAKCVMIGRGGKSVSYTLHRNVFKMVGLKFATLERKRKIKKKLFCLRYSNSFFFFFE